MFQVAQWSDAEWDRALDKVVIWTGNDHSVGVWTPHNYSGWARLKELDGWSHLRLVDDTDTPIAQVLVKRKGSVAVAYAPGGFLAARHIEAREFVSFLRRETGAAFVYARIHMLTPTKFFNPDMHALGWAPVSKRLGAAESLKMRLDHPVEERRAALSFNWRRNLKRCEQHENVITIESNPNAEEIVRLHAELESLKGEHVNTWESSLPHVQIAIKHFGSRLVVAKCVNEQGVLRAIRGAVVTGGCAFDVLAATTYEGRKHYASHGTMWALANELACRGVVRYDLGGVDPVGNRGVYDFKHGTGAMEITYGGEYDAAFPAIARRAASMLAVRFR